MAQNLINENEIFTAEAISAGEAAYATVDLKDWRPDGYFGVQIYLTGAGTLKMEWMISADGKVYLCPTGYDNVICSNFTKSSGSHSLEYNDTILIRDVSGMTEINGLTGTVTTVAAGSVITDINSSAFSAYTSGGIARPTSPAGKGMAADTVITGISKAAAAVVSVDRGRDWFRITKPDAPYLKIKATETGGASAIALTARLIGV